MPGSLGGVHCTGPRSRELASEAVAVHALRAAAPIEGTTVSLSGLQVWMHYWPRAFHAFAHRALKCAEDFSTRNQPPYSSAIYKPDRA